MRNGEMTSADMAQLVKAIMTMRTRNRSREGAGEDRIRSRSSLA